MDQHPIEVPKAAPPATGFGLIETLVAMALVLLLIVGAAEMLTLSLRAKRRGDVLAAITHAVSDRLEELKTRPFDDARLAPGQYSADVSIEPYRALLAETWEITEDGDGQKRVRMSVREAGRTGPETIAVLFISRSLGFRP
jgi:Tfp pilus assembly protein PilV